jgi:tetratricopeptide (TPR) repeat protein
MAESTQSEIVRKAIVAIDRGDTLQGLIALEHAPTLRTIPVVNSYLAYCMSKERGQHREALKLCEAAIKQEPQNPAHYLNLGRIYLITGHKAKAVTTFRSGLAKEVSGDGNTSAESPAEMQARHQALILAEMRRMGIRKRAPFPSLPRSHPLNRVFGRVLTRLAFR